MVEKKAPPKRPVGRPRTKNLDLAPGLTRSGDPPRVRVSGSASGTRDAYKYRQDAEKKLGRKLSYNEVLDHIDQGAKADPDAKVRLMSRSDNSKKDGGTRPNKGKSKK